MHVKKNYKSKKSNEERLERAKGNKVMRKNQFRAFAGVAALSLCLGLGAAAMPANVKAAEAWDYTTISTDRTFVALAPGENETELNFAWYSKSGDDAKVRFGTTNDIEALDEFSGTSQDIEGTKNDDVNANYFSNKVTVTGLKENTTYYYSVMKDGEWTEPEKYETKSFSDFSFLYVGDPQIGASGTRQNDAANWEVVLNQATKNHDVSFMVSAGDQINNTKGDSEEEYSGYLGATALRSLPVATTIGNHDSKNPNYSYHFNYPNSQYGAPLGYNQGVSTAGTDYYYTYGNVLFIVLDTNNYNCATHENVIRKAITENPDAKWRVVTFHQDIYGAAQSHSDSDGMVLRTQLTPLMDKYDIDVVLQGHDHTYSRTYQLTGDGEEHTAFGNGYDSNSEEFQSENICYDLKSDVVGGTVTNPEGTVYYEANSATGSKYYDMFNPVQDYIAEKSQSYTPTYSVISVTDDTFSVTTYNAGKLEAGQGTEDGGQLAESSTYTIKKTEEPAELPPADDEQNVTNVTNNNYNITVNKKDDAAASTDTNATANANTNTNVAAPAATTAVAPKKVNGVKVANKAGNKVSVKWNTVAGVDGYQIQYTYKKGFKKQVKTVNINKATKASKTIKKMKVGKKVYVKVRAYQNVNGQKVFGNFSKVKKLTVR